MALACVFSLAVATTASAQGDSTPLLATVHTWAEETWLAILDRTAARGGRFSDDGILQRFQSTIDPDYGIDKVRYRFGMLDDAEWYRHTNGARCYVGSVSTTTFADSCEFQQTVPLGRRWSTGLRFDSANFPELNRNLPRLKFARTAENGFFWSIETAVMSDKPSIGVETGAGWKQPQSGRELSLFFGVLSAFSNFLYDGLGLVGSIVGDSAVHYVRQPFTLRVNVSEPLGSRWWIDTRAGVMPLATVRQYLRATPDSGFQQDELYGFFGTALQYRPHARLTVGGFATFVRAVIDRSPPPVAPPRDDFRVTERTTQVGALLLARVGGPWVVTDWLGRTWRPHMKEYRTAGGPDVNYEDVAWSGQLGLELRPDRGFAASASWDFDLWTCLRGAGEVPGNVESPGGRDNHEARFELGYRAANRYSFQAGMAFDLNPIQGARRAWFSGGEARMILYW
jgi:hypothetical protein